MTGEIPSFLGSLIEFEFLNLAANNLAGGFPIFKNFIQLEFYHLMATA